MQHDHALAFLLALGIERLAARRAGDAVLAGDQLLQALTDAANEILRARLAPIVGDEDLRQAGVLEHGAAPKGHVGEDQALARADRPVKAPAFPGDVVTGLEIRCWLWPVASSRGGRYFLARTALGCQTNPDQKREQGPIRTTGRHRCLL